MFTSGTPEECLTPLVSHPLDDLKFIDSGLGGQVRIHLSIHGTHVPQIGAESSFPQLKANFRFTLAVFFYESRN